MESHDTIPKFKVILLGEVGVGKTSFFIRVRDGVFRDPQTTTLGVDNCSCTLKAGGKAVQLTLWDTAGVERFRTLTRNFYRNAHAVLLMFTVDDPSTLYYLSKWEQDAREYAPNALHFLVGNKNDLDCLVKQDVVQTFARSHGCENAFLTSAKAGQGISEVLATVTEKLVRVHTQQKYDMENSWLDKSVHVNHGNHSNQNSSTACCGGSKT